MRLALWDGLRYSLSKRRKNVEDGSECFIKLAWPPWLGIGCEMPSDLAV
jgi:hypothetical protein